MDDQTRLDLDRAFQRSAKALGSLGLTTDQAEGVVNVMRDLMVMVCELTTREAVKGAVRAVEEAVEETEREKQHG